MDWAMIRENVDFVHPIFWPYFIYCTPNIRPLPSPLPFKSSENSFSYSCNNDKIFTPHLNGKKLSMNSSWDFEHVFETMDDY